MAAEVDISNRALAKLGAQAIVALTDDSRNARACNANYAAVRDAELEAHPWAFSIKRATLAADGTAPDWGRAYGYQTPNDFFRILPPYPEDEVNTRDWIIEGQKILTDDVAPLYIRYVSKVTDPNVMSPLFREALASKLAWEICELITGSNTKQQLCESHYEKEIAKAKRTGAIQTLPAQAFEDTWTSCRA